ncbi:hypothetical protein C8F04DRAFT_1196512 [Mycena alexandri]|uniref:Uncharacterized protein n=1 Tax=Mycena alexandri TaxID=1745969 RepID=A0AAD6S463_9AGAR|nr:hypothetical protein C8F04DRAFT_1196512 [Mycena alexandri]
MATSSIVTVASYGLSPVVCPAISTWVVSSDGGPLAQMAGQQHYSREATVTGNGWPVALPIFWRVTVTVGALPPYNLVQSGLMRTSTENRLAFKPSGHHWGLRPMNHTFWVVDRADKGFEVPWPAQIIRSSTRTLEESVSMDEYWTDWET